MSEEGIQVGFLSYLTRADELEEQRITQLRKRLESEITLQIGKPCRIFQDRRDIKWGQDWARLIQQALGEVSLLFPVLTPGFFQSKYCRQELEQFLMYEQQRGRNDLILPIHYVEVDELTQPEEHEPDSLVELIRSRQVVDWRELRHEPHTNPVVGRTVAELAKQVRFALKRKGAKGERTSSSETAVPAAPKTAAGGAVASSGAAEPVAASESPAAPGGQRAPAAHTEPVTLVVDLYGRHGYPSIGRAIQKAPPGARIIVCPGLYEEALVIDKPLELIGDGNCEDIVVRTKGANVILFKASMGRVSNLTLRQQGGGNWYAVNVTQGRLDLEDCDISSESSACVGIHDGADPRLRRNRIHDGKQGGVLVYENGQGTLEDNEIWGNAFAGVEIKQGGNPTLRRNRIYRNKYEAIWIHEGGGGTFEDNDLRGNKRGAWDIEEDCLPNVNRVRNKE